MPERRHFIQTMGGDPIRIRYARRDSFDPETGAVDWTEHPSERHEWEDATEARKVRDAIGVGVVLPTQRPDEGHDPDIDAEAKRSQKRHQPQPPSEPIADKDLPWWQR